MNDEWNPTGALDRVLPTVTLAAAEVDATGTFPRGSIEALAGARPPGPGGPARGRGARAGGPAAGARGGGRPPPPAPPPPRTRSGCPAPPAPLAPSAPPPP